MVRISLNPVWLLLLGSASAAPTPAEGDVELKDELVHTQRKAIIDCQSLGGQPADDRRWNFETASHAKCQGRTNWHQHWSVSIPNDHIFDETKIRTKGDYACGSSVFDSLTIGCAPGFFSCSLGDDNVAHLEFTCARYANPKVVNGAFHKATCNAFPEVDCWMEA